MTIIIHTYIIFKYKLVKVSPQNEAVNAFKNIFENANSEFNQSVAGLD